MGSAYRMPDSATLITGFSAVPLYWLHVYTYICITAQLFLMSGQTCSWSDICLNTKNIAMMQRNITNASWVAHD